MPMPKEMKGHATEEQYNALKHDRLSPEDRETADRLLAQTFGNFEAGTLDATDVKEILGEAKKLADLLAEPFDFEGFEKPEVEAARNTVRRIKADKGSAE